MTGSRTAMPIRLQWSSVVRPASSGTRCLMADRGRWNCSEWYGPLKIFGPRKDDFPLKKSEEWPEWPANHICLFEPAMCHTTRNAPLNPSVDGGSGIGTPEISAITGWYNCNARYLKPFTGCVVLPSVPPMERGHGRNLENWLQPWTRRSIFGAATTSKRRRTNPVLSFSRLKRWVPSFAVPAGKKHDLQGR
jgi:hypothetical protein